MIYEFQAYSPAFTRYEKNRPKLDLLHRTQINQLQQRTAMQKALRETHGPEGEAIRYI